MVFIRRGGRVTIRNLLLTTVLLLTIAYPAAADTDLILREKRKVNDVSESEMSITFSANRNKTLWFRIGGEVDTVKASSQRFIVLGVTAKGRHQDWTVTVVPRKEVTVELRMHLSKER